MVEEVGEQGEEEDPLGGNERLRATMMLMPPELKGQLLLLGEMTGKRADLRHPFHEAHWWRLIFSATESGPVPPGRNVAKVLQDDGWASEDATRLSKDWDRLVAFLQYWRALHPPR